MPADCMNYLEGAWARVLMGGPGTGMMPAAARQAAALVEAGGRVDELLLVGPSPAAAQALAEQVAGLLGVESASLRVATPVLLGRQILETARAAGDVSVRARVLEPFEESVLFEDVKVTGVRERRLRELLKFLERGWSEMRDGDEGWLVTGEEKLVSSTARRCLRALGACLPCEVCAEALRIGPAPSAGARWVVADGYRAMGRASQRLVRLLAQEGLVVGWDTLGGLRGEEPYGYDEGLDELAAEAGEGLELLKLEAGVQAAGPARALDNVLAQRCLEGRDVRAPLHAADGRKGVFEACTCVDLAQEMDVVADAVERALERGDAPEEVFVAVPTDAWGRRAVRALKARGIAVDAVAQKPALLGDFRDPTQCGAETVYTALRLVADPSDAPALRCWCAMGDYLGLSQVMRAVYEACENRSMGFAEALASDTALAVGRRLNDLRDLRDAVCGLRGEELVRAVCARVVPDGEVPIELAGLLGELGDCEDAAQLVARVAERLAMPAFGPGVRVGGWDALLGQAPKTVVLCGLVNGLVPRASYFDLERAGADAQDRMHLCLIARLAQVVGTPSEALVCTAFEQAGIVEAEKLGLVSKRVCLRGGRRVCELTPSACMRYVRGELLERQVV